MREYPISNESYLRGLLNNQNLNPDYSNRWMDLFYDHRYKIWTIGFILRLIASGTNLKTYDYIKYRIPISHALNDGTGLYSDLKYNQMPVYPYLSTLMYFLFGDQNEVITAMILLFPIVLADSIIPIVLYYLGIELERKKEGIITSTIYVFNPLSLIEISVASFHSIAILFFLLSIYFLLRKRYFISGICISFGFFTSQFPIIALGVTFVYVRHDLQYFLQSIFGFGITSTAILYLVITRSNTTLDEMYHSLKRHPIYKGTLRGVVSELFEFLHKNYGVSEKIYYDIWLIVFLFFSVLPLMLYMRDNNKTRMVDVLVTQMCLLSIFFTANHTKHIFWLFPWLTLWAFMHGGKTRLSVLFLTIIYLIRGLVQIFFNDYVWTTTIFVGIIGIWIISISLQNLLIREVSTQVCTNKTD